MTIKQLNSSPAAENAPTPAPNFGWDAIPLDSRWLMAESTPFFGAPILVADNGNHAVVEQRAVGVVVVVANGEMQAQSASGDIRMLKPGDTIYLHDTLSTSARGFAKIRLQDGTIFQLGPSSRMSLDSYSYHQESGGGEFESSIFLGVFRFISGKISDDNQGRHTLIHTPTATIGIRGSALNIEVAQDGTTTVLHAKGLIDVYSPLDANGVSVWEPGTRVVIAPNQITARVDAASADMVRHFEQHWRPIEFSEQIHQPDVNDQDNPQEPVPPTTPESMAANAASLQSPPASQEPASPELEAVQADSRHTIQTTPIIAMAPTLASVAVEPPVPSLAVPALEPVNLASTQPEPRALETVPMLVAKPLPAEPPAPPAAESIDAPAEAVPIITLMEDHGQLIDVDSGTGALFITRQPEHGMVWISSATQLAYTPFPGFSGTDTLAYQTRNAGAAPGPPQVEVNLTVPELKTAVNTELAVLAAPRHGELQQGADGSWTFWPHADFAGTDQLTYQTGSTTHTVQITVLPINDPPYARAPLPTLDTRANTPVELSLAAIAATLADKEGHEIHLAQAHVQHGVLQWQDERLFFVPEADFTGVAALDFAVQDSEGAVSCFHMPITIHAPSDNDMPPAQDVGRSEGPARAHADVLVAAADFPIHLPVAALLANDQGKDIQIASVSSYSAGGIAALVGSEVILTQPATAATELQFSYTLRDGQGHTDTAQARVLLTKSCAMPAPNGDSAQSVKANADFFTLDSRQPLIFPVEPLLANDIGAGLQVTRVFHTAEAKLTLTSEGRLILALEREPPDQLEFSYEIQDIYGNTSQAQVHLAFTHSTQPPPIAAPANHAPLAQPDTLMMPENPWHVDTGLLVEHLLINDIDADGDTLRLARYADAQGMKITLSGTDTVLQLTGDSHAPAGFRYAIQDEPGEIAWTDVRVFLQPPSSGKETETAPDTRAMDTPLLQESLPATTTASQVAAPLAWIAPLDQGWQQDWQTHFLP